MRRAAKSKPKRPDTIGDAIDRGTHFWNAEPRASSARYDSRRDELVIHLTSGVKVSIPRRLLQGLENAPKRKLSYLITEGSGTGLSWPDLDVDHYVPGLLRGIFGTQRWMAEIGKKGGSSSSPAKVRAARANGQKGGRPKSVA